MDLSNPISAVIPSLEGQVLRVLAGTSQPLTASTIARLVSRGSAPGVRVALRRLTATGTVVQDQVGSQYEYRANRTHAAWSAIQSAVDFANGFRTRLDAQIAHLVAEAAQGARVTCAVFGSTARGTADADSDIDLLLVVPDDAPEVLTESLSRRVTEGVEAFTGNPANVLLLTAGQRDEMVGRDDALVRSWRAEARTVHGPALLPTAKEA
ncbi:nucleotidyltransferase domain-containing protein [Kineococcus arenarius]|uniref:nucleotidyltransferase domain-containing protein n=1 Tax=unclassified Kineococcus TaxID=2621656 RepID=UPI003D7E9CEB